VATAIPDPGKAGCGHFRQPVRSLFRGVYTVFITHQLRISSSFGRIGDALLQRLNYGLINRFSACWIPDMAADGGLAGNLSHPEKLPIAPTRYIGILSRFGEGDMAAAGESGPDLLILLSGPEPQRTLFERMILEQLPAYHGRTVLIRGCRKVECH